MRGSVRHARREPNQSKSTSTVSCAVLSACRWRPAGNRRKCLVAETRKLRRRLQIENLRRQILGFGDSCGRKEMKRSDDAPCGKFIATMLPIGSPAVKRANSALMPALPGGGLWKAATYSVARELAAMNWIVMRTLLSAHVAKTVSGLHRETADRSVRLTVASLGPPRYLGGYEWQVHGKPRPAELHAS